MTNLRRQVFPVTPPRLSRCFNPTPSNDHHSSNSNCSHHSTTSLQHRVRNSKHNGSSSRSSSSFAMPTPPCSRTDMQQPSNSFLRGQQPEPDTTTTSSSSSQPSNTYGINAYPGLLSYVANELRRRIILNDREKDGIEYKNTFTGQDGVDKILAIICSKDRHLAVRVGRALDSQHLFHDVAYERHLVDSPSEIYQFNDRVLVPTNTRDSESPEIPPATTTRTPTPTTTDDPFYDEATTTTGLFDDHGGIEATAATNYDFPSGVFVDLTRCYTPACMFDESPCYSYLCPKRLALTRQERDQNSSNLERSSLSASSLQYQRPRELWIDTVDPHVRQSISTAEWKRQEAIFELIFTEDNFVRTMEYVNEMWIEPLSHSESIIPDYGRRHTFIQNVFSNIMAIYQVHVQFLASLQDRQRERCIVEEIGDIVLEFADYFDLFVDYGASRYQARFILEHERMANIAFSNFVVATEDHPASRRLQLNGYLSQPTTRLGRYTLLLDEILKYTPCDHPDQVTIPKALARIRSTLWRMNTRTGESKNRFDLQRINAHLRFKNPVDKVDLHLLDPERRIVKEDRLTKSPNPGSTEYQVILLDNYLLIARIKVQHGVPHYIIQRRPIPIIWLSVSTTEPKQPAAPVLPVLPGGIAASIGPHMAHHPIINHRPSAMYRRHSSLKTYANQHAYPITFHHMGRRGSGSFTLFSPSAPARKPWLDKIHELQSSMIRSTAVFNSIPAIKESEIYITDKANHMVTFNDGRQYVLATSAGVFVGHNEPASVSHKILAVERVSQIEVLEGAQKLLVLADRTLWEYALQVVNNSVGCDKRRKQIQSSVPFFHVGHCLGTTLVCIPKGTFSSRIVVYEPQKLEDYSKKQKRAGRVPNPLDLPLKKFGEYHVPSEIWDIELSNTKMFVTTPRGIIILSIRDPKSIMPMSLLNYNDPLLSFITIRERDQLRTIPKRINFFRTPDAQHIVCYDEFAFYIDGQGNRARPEFLIEWKGTPESFIFSYPYLLAFEPNFIEIRDTFTGELVQVIRGKNIKCLTSHHLYRSKVPFIFGAMTDPSNDCVQYIFRLDPIVSSRKSAPPALLSS